jgi:hypothetical protein
VPSEYVNTFPSVWTMISLMPEATTSSAHKWYL